MPLDCSLAGRVRICLKKKKDRKKWIDLGYIFKIELVGGTWLLDYWEERKRIKQKACIFYLSSWPTY